MNTEPNDLSAHRAGERVVEPAEFEPDLTAADWTAKFPLQDVLGTPIHFAPYEVLTPAKTVGRGRTNLTLIRPTIVQTDATTPFASFDLRESPNRNPAVSVHFNPSAYGITWTGTYVFTFAVDAPTRAGFTPSGFAGSGTVDAAGSIRFAGRRVITVILRNVPPNQDVNAAIEQTSGEAWSWFSTSIGRPPLVIDTVSSG
jgi:hypothetical protein